MKIRRTYIIEMIIGFLNASYQQSCFENPQWKFKQLFGWFYLSFKKDQTLLYLPALIISVKGQDAKIWHVDFLDDKSDGQTFKF